ncbi:family 43 glycosylhydrolase [Phycisphaera mikurensis]|uniref:Putative glycoside hydrolase n=1 Tax=Phycisphaera mikurensis (strain NBRC 102666 / KCTC 22515 / FYK2301M01) TaxID=1142394 RepID=I0IBL2_PHYMF|nr:family 43 glycosylhydrolase [Phycisphaera mikurensis]MBB6442821.1 hypothetical protein [Phycisphaera mikurensis]BAM02650.1 putative glycoside hydrolase [Phycisphaera mikurensis NBRC 102666]
MPTIQNHSARRDVHGEVIDCHDGCLRFFGGSYFLYGTAYGDSDGFTPANRYVVYASPNLKDWIPRGDLLAAPLPGVSYRPYVVRRPCDGRYVLWFNWYPELWEGRFGVAVSDTPEGPFEVVDEAVEVSQPEPGDHNVAVGADGTGWLIYTSIPDRGQGDHGMSVERLSGDLCSSTGENSGFLDFQVEAPSLFEHAGSWWALFGNTCCFCPEGAGARLYRAQHPLGPWAFVRDINRDDDGGVIVAGQQTDVAPLPGGVLLFMADRWGSRGDGVKGHDLQHWEPLALDDRGVPRRLQNLPEASW